MTTGAAVVPLGMISVSGSRIRVRAVGLNMRTRPFLASALRDCVQKALWREGPHVHCCDAGFG
ncbi:MAG: hypothetical protein ACR2M5_10865, partial [Nakamurella sp.]